MQSVTVWVAGLVDSRHLGEGQRHADYEAAHQDPRDDPFALLLGGLWLRLLAARQKRRGFRVHSHGAGSRVLQARFERCEGNGESVRISAGRARAWMAQTGRRLSCAPARQKISNEKLRRRTTARLGYVAALVALLDTSPLRSEAQRCRSRRAWGRALLIRTDTEAPRASPRCIAASGLTQIFKLPVVVVSALAVAGVGPADSCHGSTFQHCLAKYMRTSLAPLPWWTA